MKAPFEVHAYSPERLQEIIANVSDANVVTIDNKFQCKYFREYFHDLDASTIVVEKPYVDRDFLEDFSAYYVRCFHEYKRWCARLHFFSRQLDTDDLRRCLVCDPSSTLSREILQDSYLGFIVVKPLPQTVIGRTCLSVYPPEGRRYFPITREYSASLFGTKLTIETLAFQEQDQVVAACATSALWSAFQTTGYRFQHAIPSPYEITRVATQLVPADTRMLPNSGLTAEMMAQAIRHVGLEPVALKPGDEQLFKGTLYAYLRGKIPVILGVRLVDTSRPHQQEIGLHAVTATGYSLAGGSQTPTTSAAFPLYTSRMDRIYAHDDQIGPYARMKITNGPRVANSGQYAMTTSWPDRDGQIGNVFAVPDLLLLPIYHKIRLNYRTIHDIILSFHEFLRIIARRIGGFRTFSMDDIEWDIYLTEVNDFKAAIRQAIKNGQAWSPDVLFEQFPHYLWVATAVIKGESVLTLVFDATDIEQGEMISHAIDFTGELGISVGTVMQSASVGDLREWQPIWPIIKTLKKASEDMAG